MRRIRVLVLSLFAIGFILTAPAIAQDEKFHGNYLFQVLKAIGDKRAELRSEKDVRDIALGVVTKLSEVEFESELLAFGPNEPIARGRARVGEDYIVQYEARFPRADVAVEFIRRSLSQASMGFHRLDRVTLSWVRIDHGNLELIDARISSDAIVP